MTKKTILLPMFIAAALVLVLSGCAEKKEAVNNSQNLPSSETESKKESKVSGELDIKGSDTLLQLVSSMSEAFSEKNTQAEVAVTGGGSGTGIAALLNGEIKVANASRDVKQKEIDKIAEKGGSFKKFIVARDGLSIIVNKDNPVDKLTVDQIGKIYRGEINNWKEVGGDSNQINLYGRQSTSGTYEFMKDEVLKGDYASTMRNMEGNQAIVDAVKEDSTGIGYVGIGYAVNAGSAITILDVAAEGSSTYYSPTNESNITSGKYPVSRPLFQIMADYPEKNGLIHKFMEFEISSAGLEITKEAGFYPPSVQDKASNDKFFSGIK